MKRMLLVILVLIAAAAGGMVAWKFSFGRGEVPVDVAPAIAALHAHLAAQGIDTDVFRVKNMSSHAETRALFSVRRSGKPTFFVYACRNAAGAARQLEDLQKSSPRTQPEANGSLVMNVSENPDDPVFEAVRRGFRTYREGMVPASAASR
jgi:hypothetical protein